MKFEWCSPSIIDYKEWRGTVIEDLNQLAVESLNELKRVTNLYVIWRDRSVYLFVRAAESKQVICTYQVEYLGDNKFTTYKV